MLFQRRAQKKSTSKTLTAVDKSAQQKKRRLEVDSNDDVEATRQGHSRCMNKSTKSKKSRNASSSY